MEGDMERKRGRGRSRETVEGMHRKRDGGW
jgi:hypothetical protein